MKEGRADNYALIMKDHGTSLGYNCSDEGSGSIMAIKDIAELLKSDKYKDLSVVAFDQCLMGSDVVVTTMEGTVDYVVASEAVGYTPNWLVMYKVLLNSFETEMTPQEVSQKIVAACNCSGLLDLTMASFKSDENTLSSALEQFGELSKQFTYADWVALCKCYSKVHNYGDEICAYSDLGSILNLVKGYHETISSTLLDATNALYDTVMNTVIDSTMITPDVYGTGLAVFNPIYSDPMMSAYTYGGGSTLDYYATDIGKTSWGEFMYTLSKIADECSDYIVDANGNLTFTSFTYYYENGEIKSSYDLGAFNGDGVSFEGLYMDHAAYFNVTLEQAGIDGDSIVVTADNPNAEITIELVQTLIPTDAQLFLGAQPYPETRRFSDNGVLPLDGVDYDKNRAMNDYTLIIRSTEETTYDLKFVGNWTNGVDFFDYSRTGSISPLAAGNNSIDKATSLPNGNYGGLVTCAGDKDYYKILSVYANTIDVTVKGTGLVVQKYNAEGELLQTAIEENGEYKLTVAKDNYVCVEGAADITANECNPYVLCISDAAQMYMKAELNAMLPDKPVVTSELKDNQVSISVDVNDGLEAFYSKDMNSWLKYDAGLVATENDRYYFKAVDTETKVESKYTSLRVVGIDHVAPTVDNVLANITAPTNTDVTVTAEFADDVALAFSLYRIGEDDGEWLDYDVENGVLVKENATVYFKAVDVAGNESEIASYVVDNIDMTKPVITLSGDNQTPLQSSTLTASVDDGSDIYYSMDQQTWTKYEAPIDVNANTTYYFKATDAAGNEGTNFLTFDKIDTVAPLITLSGDNQTPLQQATLTASVDDGNDIYFSTDQQTWTKYEAPIDVNANATYYFKATDAAGNEGTNFLTFNNIDTTKPVIALSGDNQTPLQKAMLTATVDDGSPIYYRIGDTGEWTEYKDPITVTSNATYNFLATDAAENEGTNFLTFENIDTVAPVITLSGDNQTPLQQTTLTATVDDGSPIYYRIGDSGDWMEYKEPITVTDNATYNFRSTDAAGNEGTNSITFANIDTVAPVITLTGDNQTPLRASTLTAAVDDDSAIYYSLDQATWMKYEGEISVTANAMYYFSATDAAGNVGTAEYIFANIDTTAPVFSLTGDNQKPLRTATLTAEVDDGSSIFFSTDQVNWSEYTGPITVNANATYYFTATDAAGNVGTAEYVFANIDNVAPVITLTGNNQTPVQSAMLTATVDDGSKLFFSTDGVNWTEYTEAITVNANATYYFTATDAAGNEGTNSFTFANIDTVAPVITLTGDNQTSLQKSMLTAAVDDGSIIFFSTDQVNWTEYTDAITVTANGTYYFKAKDAAGNVGTAEYVFANIDTVPPTAPAVSADVTTPTNTDVYVSATFSADSVKTEFSLDGVNWNAYSGPIRFAENGTVSFRGTDAAGNVSDVTTYEVSNIDKVALDKPIATANILIPTNTDVRVSAIFPEDAVSREYSRDNLTWQPYTEAIVLTENGTVYFRNIDKAGNISEVTAYEVTNIDKVAPEKPVAAADVTELTNKDVTVSATFSEDSVKKEYSLDGETWQAYTEAVKLTENGTVSFRGIDAAGNVSEVTTYEVTNIDKTAPVKPTAVADVIELTNGDVTVTATFSEDSVKKEYTLDGGETWQDYPAEGVVIIIINGMVGFRGTDAAGNVSEVAKYEVTNIDKTAPGAPSGLVAEVSDQTVTLSWSASTDNLSGVKGYVVTYSHDGQEFSANTTATSFVIENAEAATWNWTVKAVDAVDNVSEVAAGEAFTVEQAVGPEPPTPAKYVAKFDVDGNGISDVMFVWTGNNYQHGYWMNGTSEWQSQNGGHPTEWDNLGCHDMTGDGKADSVLVGNVEVGGVKGAYIGYYADAIDSDSNWTNIGYLTNVEGYAWKNAVGNLTGGTANSIVWYAPELYALGAWTDGTDSWGTLSNSFGGTDWTLVGCGDFDGDGKDSVVMSGLGGQYFYTADLDGAVTSMGAANWSGWEVRAIGDFAADGKDDLVLFHPEYGSMVMLADGNLDDYKSIGQLDATDWFVVGAGDYNGDQQDDLLVRQYSTGMLGYYASGDTTQWTELGRGVDMNWTVIA